MICGCEYHVCQITSICIKLFLFSDIYDTTITKD